MHTATSGAEVERGARTWPGSEHERGCLTGPCFPPRSSGLVQPQQVVLFCFLWDKDVASAARWRVPKHTPSSASLSPTESRRAAG